MKKGLISLLLITMVLSISACSLDEKVDKIIEDNSTTTRASYGEGSTTSIMAEIGTTDSINKTKMVYKMEYPKYTLYYVINFKPNGGDAFERIEYYFYAENSKDEYEENKTNDFYKTYGEVLYNNDDCLVTVLRTTTFLSSWETCEKRYSNYIIN